jgi:hypothetical protein
MKRLLIHLEGQTEETFVNEVLAPHLFDFGYEDVSARIIGSARYRGGIPAWESARRDLAKKIKQTPRCSHTTMVDYYRLPTSKSRAWPGRVEANSKAFAEKARTVEAAMFHAIEGELEMELSPDRFIPFVLMHEYEGLLFSDCDKFARGIERPELAEKFQEIRDQFNTPEEINDAPDTAPSKRVEELVVGYNKPLLGTLAALEIGLRAIRGECPHFHQWITRLEGLPRRSGRHV